MSRVPRRGFTLDDVIVRNEEWVAHFDKKLADETFPLREAYLEYWQAMRDASQQIVDACTLLRATYEAGPNHTFYMAKRAIAAL